MRTVYAVHHRYKLRVIIDGINKSSLIGEQGFVIKSVYLINRKYTTSLLIRRIVVCFLLTLLII